MNYLRKFNELKPITYREAAKKLKTFGHLKILENFSEIDKDDIEEILLPINHYGFTINDITKLKSTRITDNGQFGSKFTSFNIFFKPSMENKILDDGFFEELEYGIKHIESLYKVKLVHIFTFYNSSNYSKTVNDFKEYYKNNKNFTMFEIQFEEL